MTTSTGSTATVFELDVPAKRADVPTLDFRVSGELFTLVRPKLSVAAGLLAMMDSNLTAMTEAEAGVRVADAMWRILGYVKAADAEPEELPDGTRNPDGGKLHGRARLLQRLNDPDDGMDVLDLAPLFDRVIRTMFGNRPTGPSAASSPAPTDGGHDSAAASSEPPA